MACEHAEKPKDAVQASLPWGEMACAEIHGQSKAFLGLYFDTDTLTPEVSVYQSQLRWVCLQNWGCPFEVEGIG